MLFQAQHEGKKFKKRDLKRTMSKTIVRQYLRKVFKICIHKTLMLIAYRHNKLHQNFNFLLGSFKVYRTSIAILILKVAVTVMFQ